MFSSQKYIIKAKKEANNYLKMTRTMGIIRSQKCNELAQDIEQLSNDDYQNMITILKKYTNQPITPAPLKGCHRHFLERMKMLYRQIKYDQELHNIIENPSNQQPINAHLN